jgi:peptidyl-prolyl cis-trans isomerase A (cyclophilin A)/peptidyl-prolyl cis-trans isomerase B (cyclophilin B)
MQEPSMFKRSIAVLFALMSLLPFSTTPSAAANPKVKLTTNFGLIVVELYPDKAPQSTANFLRYVREGHYAGTLFHRVIPGFMIQGGGFDKDFHQKPTHTAIPNEAGNGLKNLAGTIAMARTGDPNSATAQFFINTVDNAFLDHKDDSDRGYGYAVFGKVVEGMDVVKQIEALPTHNVGPFGDVPVRDAYIEKAEAF